MRALLLGTAGLLACSAPPYLSVAIVEGAAERVTTVDPPRLAASFVLQMTAPREADPTDVLLVDLLGVYRYPNPCGPKPVLMQVSADRSMPVRVQPGTEQRVLFDLGASDPVIDECRVPDVLELEGSYYDSARDEYLHERSTPIRGEIALELDPNLSGPSDYSCIGKVPEPPYGSGSSKGIVWLRAYESGEIVPGAPVKSCAIQDPDCASPIDEGTTDVVGFWPLAVPNSSPFFYDVGAVTGFASTLFFEYFPPQSSGFEHILTPMAEGELDAILAGLAVSAQAGHGHVAVRLLDCDAEPGVGLSVTPANGDPAVGYWNQGALDPAAPSTTVDGFAFMANVPAGPATIEARLAVAGDFVGSRVLHVREGAVSFVVIDPTPTR